MWRTQAGRSTCGLVVPIVVCTSCTDNMPSWHRSFSVYIRLWCNALGGAGDRPIGGGGLLPLRNVTHDCRPRLPRLVVPALSTNSEQSDAKARGERRQRRRRRALVVGPALSLSHLSLPSTLSSLPAQCPPDTSSHAQRVVQPPPSPSVHSPFPQPRSVLLHSDRRPRPRHRPSPPSTLHLRAHGDACTPPSRRMRKEPSRRRR